MKLKALKALGAMTDFRERIALVTQYNAEQNASIEEHNYMKGYCWALEKFGTVYLQEFEYVEKCIREALKE